jgi:TRAP-type C4-dicarboxylate transport system substrate-binding protein
MTMRHCALRAAAAAGALAVAFGALAQAPAVMKIGTATLNDAQHEWMKIFVAHVEKESGGRIKGELYPASQLGPIPRMVENTQFGAIQGFVGPPEFMAGVDPRFQLLAAPGLFKDMAHAQRTLTDPEFRKAFLALGANKGLKGVGTMMSGPATFVMRTKAARLADLEGKRIRVFASPMQQEQIRRLKATPVPMSLGEVLPALQQGAIDGTVASVPVVSAFHYYDAAKYVLETDHAIVAGVAVLSKIWYDKLSPDLQKIVSDAGNRASVEVFPWSVDFWKKQRDVWTKNGGELAQLSDAEREQLTGLLQPIGAEITAKNPEEKRLYDLLVATARRTAQ